MEENKMKRNSMILGLVTFFAMFTTESCTVVSHPHPIRTVEVYNDNVGFLYFPDDNLYYDYGRSGYYYHNGIDWVFCMNLPPLFAHFDFNHARRVHYREHCVNPWRFNRHHHDHYWGKHKKVIVHHDYNGRGQDRKHWENHGNKKWDRTDNDRHGRHRFEGRKYERRDVDRRNDKKGNDKGKGKNGKSHGKGR
jgi:hypothetical protein